MSLNLDFELIHGHIVALAEAGRLLVDTGSPASFGRPGAFAGLHEGAAPPASYMGVGIEAVAGFVGAPLDGLLGMDLIRRRGGFTVDWNARKLSLQAVEPGGVAVRAPWLLGCPVVPLVLGGRTVNAVIDTGAFISYAARGLTEDTPACGQVEDFHPFLGRFTTSLHTLTVSLAGLEGPHTFGAAPASVAAMLAPFGAEVVLGTDLLQRFISVGFDTERRAVVFGAARSEDADA